MENANIRRSFAINVEANFCCTLFHVYVLIDTSIFNWKLLGIRGELMQFLFIYKHNWVTLSCQEEFMNKSLYWVLENRNFFEVFIQGIGNIAWKGRNQSLLKGKHVSSTVVNSMKGHLYLYPVISVLCNCIKLQHDNGKHEYTTN